MPHRAANARWTPRLIQVADLIASGKTDAQIARTLHLSTRGVRTHVDRLLDCTGASNRTEAAIHVIVNGIIETDGRAVIPVEHLQVLTAALREAEVSCPAVAGLADRFEAVYPAVSATAATTGATLDRVRHQIPDSEEAP